MPQSAQQSNAAHLHANHSVRGSKILVIDDGEAVRDVVRIFLEKEGFQVCGEAAGVEGTEQAKKVKPDLIVLDISMPRMNGVEAACVLSHTMPGVPIVLLTMYGDFVASLLASATGIKAVVSKTDGLHKLAACVQSLLQTSRPTTPV